jgi:hypothetical protein
MEQHIRMALAGDETLLDRISLADIEKEIALAPYSAALCSLKAAAAHAQQSAGFTEDLERAAARVLSRRNLKERMEGRPTLELFWIQTTSQVPDSEPAGDLPSGPEPLLAPEATETTISGNLSETISRSEAPPTAMPAENGFTFGFVKKARKKTTPASPAETNIFQSPPVRPAARPVTRPEDALIDSFLEKNPSIKSPAISFGAPEENRDLAGTSVVLKEEIVTENMAFILMKQKNFGKAREIFRKLQLKNPEKSDYFAALIKNLDAQLPS